MLDNYDELRRLNAEADDIRGWRFLTEIYCDMLGQIQRWLDDIVAGLDDAQAALSSRMDGGGQDLQVTAPLNMTAPPEVEELTDWMERRAIAHESEMWEVFGLTLFVYGLEPALSDRRGAGARWCVRANFREG